MGSSQLKHSTNWSSNIGTKDAYTQKNLYPRHECFNT